MLQALQSLFAPLFDVLAATLTTFHGWGAPWWLSIIMLTVVVRTVLLPITFKQVKSTRKMQELKPDLDKLRKEHEEDPKKQQKAMMDLYAERKVNPLGGCLPLVVQIPIFITLYYTIREFETHRSFAAGGVMWFHDLTAADPTYVLPILYVLTMMASQALALTNVAPEQRRLMLLLPAVFGFFLARFPAGLLIYYIASNIFTFAQNFFIYRRVPMPAQETVE